MEAYRIIKRSACNIDDCAIGKKIPLIKPINPITVIKRKLETTFEERRKLLFPNLSPRRSGPYVFADLSQEELWTEEILGNTPQDYYLLTTDQLPLQRVETVTDRGLGAAQLLGGLGEAPRVHHGHEGLVFVKGHGLSSFG